MSRYELNTTCDWGDTSLFETRGTVAWEASRAALLESHAGLVRHIAHAMVCQRSSAVDVDDLVAYGTFGLIDAVERFDPGHGARFATYATHRVRGAMIDGIRNLDSIPRGQRVRVRALDRAEQDLQQRVGRSVTTAEVAAELGMTIRAVDRLRRTREALRPGAALEDDVAVDVTYDPAALSERGEQLSELYAALDCLSTRERLVLTRCYWEERTLREVGDELGVSESRVSQIRSRAIEKLRRHVVVD